MLGIAAAFRQRKVDGAGGEAAAAIEEAGDAVFRQSVLLPGYTSGSNG